MARKIAYDELDSILVSKRGQTVAKEQISLGEFDIKCEKALRSWQRSLARKIDWDWNLVQKKYRSEPRRFELAIWHRDFILCGASIGKPTYGGGKLRLDFIESNPDGSPLDGRTADISILAGTAYARAIGATQLRITNPINERVRDHYLSKPGFRYDQRNNFCYLEL